MDRCLRNDFLHRCSHHQKKKSSYHGKLYHMSSKNEVSSHWWQSFALNPNHHLTTPFPKSKISTSSKSISRVFCTCVAIPGGSSVQKTPQGQTPRFTDFEKPHFTLFKIGKKTQEKDPSSPLLRLSAAEVRLNLLCRLEWPAADLTHEIFFVPKRSSLHPFQN